MISLLFFSLSTCIKTRITRSRAPATSISTAQINGVPAKPTSRAVAAGKSAVKSGVAVINTDFGENGLWLRNESAGLIFPIGDHENLAKCILRIAGDHQMRILMGEVGRSIISEFNNSVLESKKILDFYRAAVKI